ncbi:ArsR/SmtB family transcription factor [Tsuneonella amylolytica]|jgi:DNA-binding transcriptional ArsR family regulator|uniref:ArsR/SmtB family transcription factor n=1 Tax=Tsuneonella amylolytica TaxID=2338327 RepID=UPI0018F86667|nr:metalloregulator ArsR/SmtB family transcription factor [Tsuneonella amylolytica]
MDMPLAAMEASAAKASDLLRTMANESRLMILCYLVDGEKTVGQIAEKMELSQSALSQHLGILRRERLVKTRRDRQFIHYSLDSEDAKALLETLYMRFCGPDAG